MDSIPTVETQADRSFITSSEEDDMVQVDRYVVHVDRCVVQVDRYVVHVDRCVVQVDR